MIKVNLLKELTTTAEAVPKKDYRSLIPEVNRTGLLAALLIIVIVGAMGWFWWYTTKQQESVVQELNAHRTELDRLQKVRQVADNFEKQRKALDERIQIIERLRSDQTGPVQLLNVIIACIPEQPTVWLETLTQKEKTIRLEGFATEQGAIPEFIKSLEQTGFFQSVNFDGYTEEAQAIKFSMNCVIAGAKKAPTGADENKTPDAKTKS